MKDFRHLAAKACGNRSPHPIFPVNAKIRASASLLSTPGKTEQEHYFSRIPPSTCANWMKRRVGNSVPPEGEVGLSAAFAWSKPLLARCAELRSTYARSRSELVPPGWGALLFFYFLPTHSRGGLTSFSPP